ncbi:MAG: hypothetical protein D6776_11895 [Planctomycetota bacterium]|nr:MAG: hypothetical protein D6776_11895 [Planctomycetota bacterium]
MDGIGRYDAETRHDYLEPGKPVDHGASASANLEAALEDLVLTVLPDKTFKGAVEGMAEGLYTGRARHLPLETAKGVVGDLFDLVRGPAFFVKDMTDAALHGLLLGFSR